MVAFFIHPEVVRRLRGGFFAGPPTVSGPAAFVVVSFRLGHFKQVPGVIWTVSERYLV